MDGYGNRTTPSRGVHDPLMARVVVLDYGAAGSCVIVSCDLLGIHTWIAAEVRRRVAETCGIAPDGVLVAATHDHAGPYGLRGGMFSRLDEQLAEALVQKISGAIAEAHGSRRPASLKARRAVLGTVSMNRRHPEWPTDPVMRVLLVDGDEGPIASVVNFACHATVLNGENLMLSGEFPGAAARLLLEQTGAPCVWLNGACGDVNPVWIRQDFESVERVGQIAGGQALRIIGELRTIGPGQRGHNIRWDEFPEKPVPGHLVEPRFRAARREIDLPLRPFAPDAEYADRVAELGARAQELPERSDERRDIMAQFSRTEAEHWAGAWARIRGEAALQRTEVQALSLGDGLAILGLPGEFFVETGEAIRRSVAQGPSPEPQGGVSPTAGRGPSPGRGIEDLFIACYANDYIGYVIPAGAYEQGGYESGVTFCPPEAETLVRDAALGVLREASGQGSGSTESGTGGGAAPLSS